MFSRTLVSVNMQKSLKKFLQSSKTVGKEWVVSMVLFISPQSMVLFIHDLPPPHLVLPWKSWPVAGCDYTSHPPMVESNKIVNPHSGELSLKKLIEEVLTPSRLISPWLPDIPTNSLQLSPGKYFWIPNHMWFVKRPSQNFFERDLYDHHSETLYEYLRNLQRTYPKTPYGDSWESFAHTRGTHYEDPWNTLWRTLKHVGESPWTLRVVIIGF